MNAQYKNTSNNSNQLIEDDLDNIDNKHEVLAEDLKLFRLNVEELKFWKLGNKIARELLNAIESPKSYSQMISEMYPQEPVGERAIANWKCGSETIPRKRILQIFYAAKAFKARIDASFTKSDMWLEIGITKNLLIRGTM